MAELEPAPEERIRITSEEVANAVAPPPRVVPPSYVAAAAATGPKVSRLAVASLVLAGLGIPLVGCLLGPIAIGCGAVALSRIEGSGAELKGFGIALGGVILGVLECAGWAIGLWFLLGVPRPLPENAPVTAGYLGPALSIDQAPPHIRHALEGNVRLTCASGERAFSEGSGVTVGQRDGGVWILTNRHVADCPGGAALWATFHDGEQQEAKVEWSAPAGVDLMVVRAETQQDRSAEVIRLDPAAEARIGDRVFVVGNPLGYDGSYAVGGLSAIRELARDGRSTRIYQVQGVVNPGNSGGGLYTEQGALIGINTWRIPGSAEAMGFSIGVSSVVELLREATGPVHRLVGPEEAGRTP